ncbi:PAS domain-containing protein [Sulfurimonas sp. MAG313]|nr:PAS domain-containing protein [Sulfurimonas sp. MAG313]MDF1879834.1 PAS domain-containing protein [Sulfurimonas sp. MAG313]
MHDIYKDENSDEWFYPDNAYILSETDENGIIIYANELFCKVAGYTIEELMDQPHNIVRHPDMPRIAFKGLWEDVKDKGFWTGFVKNKRKDRGYYWVYATVLRKVSKEGKLTYLSIRVKPSRADVKSHTALYTQLKGSE